VTAGDDDPGGPGPSGGLLFVGVLLFTAFLAVTGLDGLWRWLVAGALLAAALVLGARVLRRR
jgi:hypothetical protein